MSRGRKRHRKKRERWARDHRPRRSIRDVMFRFRFDTRPMARALSRAAALVRLQAALMRPTAFERRMAEVMRIGRLSGPEILRLKRAVERIGRDE